MHQQPPQTPLFASTSAAKSFQVSGVSRRVVYWVATDVTFLLSSYSRPGLGRVPSPRPTIGSWRAQVTFDDPNPMPSGTDFVNDHDVPRHGNYGTIPVAPLRNLS